MTLPLAARSRAAFAPAAAGHASAAEVIAHAVEGLHYELVDIEREARGLLRVTIDRRPGVAYPGAPSEALTVDDCERVTRQLQVALEVEGVDYARLEVSSPGLDRPLRSEADFRRFAGQEVVITLKQPFEGRKRWHGMLQPADAGAPGDAQWQLHLVDESPAARGPGGKALKAVKPGKAPKGVGSGKAGKDAPAAKSGAGAVAAAPQRALAFRLDEVREARLVPVLNFKGRQAAEPAAPQADGGKIE